MACTAQDKVAVPAVTGRRTRNSSARFRLPTGGRLCGASTRILVPEGSPTRLRCMASRGCHSASVHAVSTVDKDYSKVLEVIMDVTTAVMHYSATGSGHAPPTGSPMVGVARAPRGRRRRVEELAPPAAIDANPAWRAHLDAVGDVSLRR